MMVMVEAIKLSRTIADKAVRESLAFDFLQKEFCADQIAR